MPQSRYHPWNPLWVAAIVSLGVVCALVYSRLGIYLGHDQAFFTDAANSLALGRGFIANNYFPYATPGQIEPLAAWPPGYPFLASLLVRTGTMQAPSAMFLVGVLSYALTVAFTTLLALRSCGKTAALIAGLFIALNPAMWVSATRVMSEAPFIALILGLVLYLDGRGTRVGVSQVFLVGAMCAAAVHVRYAGYFLVLSLAMLFLLARTRSERWFFVKAGVVFFLLMLPLLLRNSLVIGDARGNVRPPTDVSFLQNVYMAGFGILEQLLPERAVTWLIDVSGSVAGPAIGFTVLFVFLGLLLHGIIARDTPPHRAYATLAVITLAYTCFYVIVRSFMTFDLLTEERLWWPVVPFLAVTAGRFVSAVRRHAGPLVQTAAVASLLAYVLLSSYYLFLGPYRKGEFAVERAVVWVQENLEPGSCLISEDEMEGFRLRPYLPHHRFIFTPDDAFADRSADAVEFLAQYGAQMECGYAIAVESYVNRFDSETNYHNSSFYWSRPFVELVDRGSFRQLTLLALGPDFTVVKINRPGE